MKNILIVIMLANTKLFAQFTFPPLVLPVQNVDNKTYSGYNVGGVTYYNQSYKDELIVAQNGAVIANNNSYVDFNSDNLITLKPGFDVNNLGPISVFSAKIANYNTDNDPPIFDALILSNHPNADVGEYERFEIGIEPPVSIVNDVNSFLNGGNGINPYDPEQIRFEAILTYSIAVPTGINTYTIEETQKTWNSFYFKDFNVTSTSFSPLNTANPFRIRIALGLTPFLITNTFKLKIKMYANNVAQNGSFQSVITVHTTAKKGFLYLNSKKKIRTAKANHHFLVGQNVPFAIENIGYGINHQQLETQRSYIEDLANKGGNFVRVRMDINSNAIEWDEAGVYGSARTYNVYASRPENFDRQFHAWELDKTLELCESHDMDMMLSLESDQYLSGSTYDAYAWPSPGNSDLPRYPYKALPGVNTPEDVFTNALAIKLFKQRIFYINARWGYSSNLGIFELMNETDNTGNRITGYNNYPNNTSLQSAIGNWHCTMSSYIKSLNPSHLVMTGYADWPTPNDNSYSCMDIESRNSYLGGDNGNYENRTAYSNGLTKPFLIGEMGSGCFEITRNSDIAFHNDVWATAFMGHLGCGLYWVDWDQVNGIDHRSNFTFMNNFFSAVDFENITWHPQRTKSAGLNALHSREVVSFFMTDNASNSTTAMGYAHNYSYSPYSNGVLGPYTDGSCVDANQVPIIFPPTNGYYVFTTNQNPRIEVDHLQIFGLYDIEFFDSWTGASIGYQHNLITDNTGTLKAHFALDYMNGTGTPPSVLFKVNTSCLGCRKSNNQEITLDYIYMVNDTVVLNVPVTGLNVTKSSIKWIKDGKTLSSDSILKYVFNKTGKYIIIEQFTTADGKYYTVTNNIEILSSETIQNNNITLYPNPSNGIFNLKYDDEKINISSILIYNIEGKLVSKITNNDAKSIDLSECISGMYLIRVINKDETIFANFKVIKN